MAQNVSRYLSHYCKKNRHQDRPKLAQSGHTDPETDFLEKYLVICSRYFGMILNRALSYS